MKFHNGNVFINLVLDLTEQEILKPFTAKEEDEEGDKDSVPDEKDNGQETASVEVSSRHQYSREELIAISKDAVCKVYPSFMDKDCFNV